MFFYNILIDEWRSGRIDVINNSSKKIWVKVDADVIQKVNSEHKISFGGSILANTIGECSTDLNSLLLIRT